MTPIVVEAEPRSIAELVFVAGLHPCRGCRGRDVSALELATTRADDRFVLDLVGACPRCRITRALQFTAACPPASLPRPERLELGGPEPSRIIPAVQFVAELDRLFVLIRGRFDRLPPAAWRRNARMIERAACSVIELMKFLDGNVIPAVALDAAGLADRATRFERYAAPWLRAERARYFELIERSTAVAPHVWHLEDLVYHK
jgi:hypothetical protein